jgi:dihydropteroate synthase
MTVEEAGQTRFELRSLLHNADRIIVMGVINVTPDSFSDGGQFHDTDKAIARGLEMVAEGVDIIDIGGESSRPGSEPVEADEELRRVLPVVRALAAQVAVPLSVDTRRSAVAEAVLDAGATIVNDISALHSDDNLASVIARFNAGLILMHMRGTPATMQEDTHYDDLLGEVRSYLAAAAAQAEAAGVDPEKIMVDPGIGFGKSIDGNLELLRRLDFLADLGKPILVGASRKSFVGKLTGAAIDQRSPGSLAAAVTAVINGAAAVRVHDVAATRQAVDLAVRLRKG